MPYQVLYIMVSVKNCVRQDCLGCRFESLSRMVHQVVLLPLLQGVHQDDKYFACLWSLEYKSQMGVCIMACTEPWPQHPLVQTTSIDSALDRIYSLALSDLKWVAN